MRRRDVVAEVWEIIYHPDLSVPERVERAEQVWRRHSAKAVAVAALASACLVEQVAASTARDRFIPAPPDTDRVGGTDDAALASWQLVAGLVLDGSYGIDDPTRAATVRELGEQWQGTAVFLCCWWGMRAVAAMAKHAHDEFPERTRAAREALGRAA